MTFLLSIPILLLTACGLTAAGRDRRSGDLAEPTPIPTAIVASRPTYEVQQGTVTYAVDFAGRVVPAVQEGLVFARNGVVSQVYASAGDSVAAGDPIAELSVAEWEAELALAQSVLAVAEAQLAASEQAIAHQRQRVELQRDLAQLDLDHAIAQGGDNPTPDQQYQIARLRLLLQAAQLEVDGLDIALDPALQNEVDKAAVRVAEIEHIIGQSPLVAPFAGILTSLNLAPGSSVVAWEAVGIIADPTLLEVSANLRDNEMQELAEGMTVTIVPANTPGEPLYGTISRLPLPFGSGGGLPEGDRSVRVRFDDPGAARSAHDNGDRVLVHAVIQQKEQVLWLPPAAIRDFNGRQFVVVKSDGLEQRLDVTLGIAGDGRVEVIDGLEAGQIVVGQ